jgi:MFS family permease
LITLVFALAFWAGTHVAWLMVVIIGFNLFFSPLVPLTDALANTWQKQFPMDYGRVRVWGSIAFVIGSAATGKLVSEFDYRAVLAMLTLGVASMLLGMLLRPSILPQGDTRHQDATGWKAWRDLVVKSWRFLVCVSLLQGRTLPTMVSAPSTGRKRGIPLQRWAISGRLGWSQKSLSLRSVTGCSVALAPAICFYCLLFVGWCVGD